MRKTSLFYLSVLIFLFYSCKKDEALLKNYSDLPLNEIASVKGGSGGGTTFTLGQVYGGGYIFYIDHTKLHGLIIAKEELGYFQWIIEGVTPLVTAIGSDDGYENTKRLVQLYGRVPKYSKPYAALAAWTYNGYGYSGWYLPSGFEQNIIYNNRSYIPGLSSNFYWSSNGDGAYAYTRLYLSDYGFGSSAYAGHLVRPIRKF